MKLCHFFTKKILGVNAYYSFLVTFFYLVPQVTPPLDVKTMSQTLKEKNILPSNLKFGFLGLGIMGSGIVKNLINSGHSVIVWNRTQEKVCTDIVFLFFYKIIYEKDFCRCSILK